MGFNGEAPAPGRGFPTSAKTQEVLDALETITSGRAEGSFSHAILLKALYEPALAVAAAINLVRQGNAGMAPFVGAAGVILSQALEPLVEHFGDLELSFEDAFERIGVPVVRFSDLPDAPDVQTPATEETDAEAPGDSDDQG